jgi:hypothetical protein
MSGIALQGGATHRSSGVRHGASVVAQRIPMERRA